MLFFVVVVFLFFLLLLFFFVVVVFCFCFCFFFVCCCLFDVFPIFLFSIIIIFPIHHSAYIVTWPQGISLLERITS